MAGIGAESMRGVGSAFFAFAGLTDRGDGADDGP